MVRVCNEGDSSGESKAVNSQSQSDGLGSQVWQMLKDYAGYSNACTGAQTPEQLGFPNKVFTPSIEASGSMSTGPSLHSERMPVQRPDISGFEKMPVLKPDISGFEKMPLLPNEPAVVRLPDGTEKGTGLLPERGDRAPTRGGESAPDNTIARLPNGTEKGTGWIPESGDRKPALPFEGESIKKFSPEINTRLGCALAVSEALHAMDPSFPSGIVSNRRLEAELKRHGYEAVPVKGGLDDSQVQPGDVIVGHRQPGMPGHAAIAKGNGQLYENNSDSGTIRGDGSLDKFNKGMHDEKGRFNKNGFADVVVYRKVGSAGVNSQYDGT